MRPLHALALVSVLAPVLSAVLAGCAREPTEVHLTLVPAEAIGCRPTRVDGVLLRALGDTPAEARPTVRLDPRRVGRIDSFPAATEEVSVRAEGVVARVGGGEEPWLGGGVALLDASDALVVPLLRFRRGCALADTGAGLPPAASVAPLDDGRLLIAGGERGIDHLRLVLVRPGEPLARTIDLGARPRVGGTATPLGGARVLLAGGRGRESFEIVDVDAGAVIAEGLLRGPRSEHDALRLPDGRVLLAGGRSESGAARRDAELIELSPTGGVARRTLGELGVARVAPQLLALDDGTVLVVGGTDAEGAPIAEVERFEPAAETFEALGAPWPARAQAAYAALAGGRVVRVGGLEGGVWSRAAAVLLDRGATHASLGAVLGRALERPRAVGLVDGRVLVTGALGGAPVAEVVDPGQTRGALEAAREPIVLGRVPSHTVRLADGVVALLDENGVSLLRLDLSGEFDDPAASINPAQVDERDELSLDGPDRWRAAGNLLVSEVDGARFDLPAARFAAVRVELTSAGALELLLTPAGAPPLAIALDDARARLGDCGVTLDGPLVVERDGATLRLASGGASQECSLAPGLGRLGVAVRARRGAGVQRLSVSRR
ncbi:MAG: hypothetical protein KF729_33100 [Sandaracinaceae bacterium]|nr:hypothetical protein [Sandaracinaceae bacterium]